MIRYQLAGKEQFDELLEIIYYQEDSYLQPILDLIQITWDQFGWLFRTTGRVYRILVDGRLAGVCWVEICDRVLRLHGLIIKNSFQGHGIGRRTLDWLEEAFRGDIDEIELRVHASNPRAKALYERCGYETMARSDPSGFFTMRKSLREPVPIS